MTLIGWIRIKVMGAPDPSLNAEIIEEIEREKLKLNGAQVALSREVDAIKVHRKRGAEIFEILDDALHALDKGNRQ